jgi:uncharacterized protein (DUF1697 family)
VSRYVALLRGVNVGGSKRVPMADLRVLLEQQGYREIRTLLNSGNAVFTGSAERIAVHSQRIRSAISEGLGVDVPVIVKTAREVAAVVADNPLKAVATDPSRYLVALTRDAKSLSALAAVSAAGGAGDEFRIGRHAAYLWCANGILESTLAVALLKGRGDAITTRNWATVAKINALLQDS